MIPMNINDPTVTISASSTSSRVAYGRAVSSRIVVSNAGTKGGYLVSGSSTVTASVADGNKTYLPAGIMATYSKTATDTYIAAVCAAGETTTFKIQVGEGN